MDNTIKCNVCGVVKKTRGFHNHLKSHYSPHKTQKEYRDDLARRKGYINGKEYKKEYQKEKYGIIPMNEDKYCSDYLGIIISESLTPKIFGSMIRMPNNNKGFDVTCGKGFKIDVKSACLRSKCRFDFHIRKNRIADYFLLIGFDDRKNLNPLHIWLIKNDEIVKFKKLNQHDILTITINQLFYFSKYELNDKLQDAIDCCNNFKRINE